jgi:chromosome segregation ATPase
VEDKTKALTALNEAVQKLECKHDELKKLQSVEDEMSKELQRAYDQIADLEDRTRDVESKLRKKDEDISYWRHLYERRNAPSDTESHSEVTSEVIDRFQCK